MNCSCQSLEWSSSLTLSGNLPLGKRGIPSAKELCSPGICFAVWFYPPGCSRSPSILMSRLALLSVAPPRRDTHETAMVSPRIIIGSPAASDLSPTHSSITHPVTTVRKTSRRSAFLLSSAASSVGRSYLQHTFFSTQNPPTASKLASDR